MLLTLLRKECMQHLKSLIYFIFVFYLVVDYFVQMGTIDMVEKPQPNQESYRNYGSVVTEDTAVIMQGAANNLLMEFERGEYSTYPVGFYKKIILNEQEQKKVQGILLDITGVTEAEYHERYQEYQDALEEFAGQLEQTGDEVELWGEMPEFWLEVQADYPYETFRQKMREIDDLLGGGSAYSESSLEQYSMVSPTYEQALEIYDAFLHKDKVAEGFARLFCDYEGITLALITIFLAVSRALKDRKSQADQVVFAHRASSAAIVLSRYFAAVIMAVIPVFCLSCATLIKSAYYAHSQGVDCDMLIFVKYIGFWLLPTILVTLALGFLLTELTDSAIAIFVQVIWWFLSLYGQESLIGCSRFNLIPRFNSELDYTAYEDMRPTLLWNRSFFTVLAFAFLAAAVLVYDKKRKGVFVSVGARLRNRKSKLEA